MEEGVFTRKKKTRRGRFLYSLNDYDVKLVDFIKINLIYVTFYKN